MSDKPLTHFLNDAPRVCLLFFHGDLNIVEQAYRDVLEFKAFSDLEASDSETIDVRETKLQHICVQHFDSPWVTLFHRTGAMNEHECSLAETLTRHLATRGRLVRLAALARFCPLTCEAFDPNGPLERYDLNRDRAFDCSLVDEFADLASEYGVAVSNHRAQDSFDDYDELLEMFAIPFSQIAVSQVGFRVIRGSTDNKKISLVRRMLPV